MHRTRRPSPTSSRGSRSRSAPCDRSYAVRGPRHPPPRGLLRIVATWTVLGSADRSVAWTARLPWGLKPRPVQGDPPLDAPEPFRGHLLSDSHPTEPPQFYTTEETRILCPISRVPEI
ncbi:hypothetical protein MTO96_035862 [Rhipicephalus appendiculatus]